MYLYEAPENGSNTIRRGADKDSVPKYPIILLVHCPPLSFTLTMCMSYFWGGFFPLAIFFFHSPKKQKCAESFPFTLSFLDHFPSVLQLK